MALNFVDVSSEAVAGDWRALLLSHNLTPDALDVEVSIEQGQPLPDAPLSEEQLLNVQKETQELVEKWLYRPLRLLFDKRFPNWHVTDEELSELCNVYSEIFAKHFPMFSEHPTVQKVESFVEDLGLEIKAMVLSWRFVKKRQGVPPFAEEEKPLKESDTSNEIQVGNGSEVQAQEPVKKTENEL